MILQIQLLLIALMVVTSNAALAVSPIVKVDAGELRGVTAKGIHSFKGIPYAQAPVGDLRWRPPAPARPWDEVRDAGAFGPSCMQTPYTKGSPYYRELGELSEDCLTLNIWSEDLRPERAAPVMVWIHGGAFTRGAGSIDMYDGTALAREGVVLVTINYRLNIFGYLAHAQLSAEQGGSSGNYGLQDQIAALQWVQNNIQAFGGDADKVTIFGESAGSSAVNQLLASPNAAGLFQRAIGQSGGFLTPQPDLAAGHKAGEMALKQAGAKDLAAMRKLDAEAVLQAFVEAEEAGARIRPLVDGKTIPRQVLSLFNTGEYNRVPVMLGYNKDETTAFALSPKLPYLFRTQKEFEQGLKMLGPLGPAFVEAYPEESGSIQPYLDFWRDMIFGWNMHAWANLSELNEQPAWLYFFTHVPGTAAGNALGAFHAAEISYIFGNDVAPGADDQRVHQLMQNYWLNFARNGNPNGTGLPQWPQYGAEKHYLEVGAKAEAGSALHEPQMKLWTMVYGR